MTKKKKNTLPTPDIYLQFLENITLRGIGLDSAEVAVDRNALSEAAVAKIVADLSIEGTFSVLSNQAETLVVGATFKLKQETKNNPEEAVMRIDCSFSALFSLLAAVDQASAERFANNEAKVIFWPYLRHFVSDISYRMAVTPMLLPLITASNKGKHT